MIEHFLLFLSCLFAVETFIRLKLITKLNQFLATSKKTLKVISSEKISDTWKEIVLPKYSLLMIKGSASIFCLLVLILLVFMLPAIFLSGYYGFILSTTGLFESIVLAFVYIKIRPFVFK